MREKEGGRDTVKARVIKARARGEKRERNKIYLYR